MHNSKVHSEQEEMKNIHKDIWRNSSTFFHRKFTRSNVTIGACNRRHRFSPPCCDGCGFKDSSKPKVSNMCLVVSIKKYVVWFHVPVHNLWQTVMVQVLQTLQNKKWIQFFISLLKLSSCWPSQYTDHVLPMYIWDCREISKTTLWR